MCLILNRNYTDHCLNIKLDGDITDSIYLKIISNNQLLAGVMLVVIRRLY